MAQYHAIKADYLDTLVFYRMGDFYEVFFADAPAPSNYSVPDSRVAATWSTSPPASRCARCGRANSWRCARRYKN